MANLSEFAPTLETTREWIDDLMLTLDVGNEARACRALRVTLHELRDQLTNEEVADFAAQLPQLIRGVFYEGWRPVSKPIHHRSRVELLERLYERCQDCSSLEDAESMAQDVFEFLSRRISAGETRHIVTSLPKGLRQLWPVEALSLR